MAAPSDARRAFASYPFGPWPINESEVFRTSPLSYAFVNLKPVVPGHVLVSPKRVAARVADLTAAETADLLLLAREVAVAVERVHDATSVTMTIQDGPEAGQTVPHVHMHVMPRKAGDFANNDDVYPAIERAEKELGEGRAAAHVDEEERKPRTPAEMAAEAAELRAVFDAIDAETASEKEGAAA